MWPAVPAVACCWRCWRCCAAPSLALTGSYLPLAALSCPFANHRRPLAVAVAVAVACCSPSLAVLSLLSRSLAPPLPFSSSSSLPLFSSSSSSSLSHHSRVARPCNAAISRPSALPLLSPRPPSLVLVCCCPSAVILSRPLGRTHLLASLHLVLLCCLSSLSLSEMQTTIASPRHCYTCCCCCCRSSSSSSSSSSAAAAAVL